MCVFAHLSAYVCVCVFAHMPRGRQGKQEREGLCTCVCLYECVCGGMGVSVFLCGRSRLFNVSE